MKKQKKIDISIIIVNYHVKIELFECISSIYSSRAKSVFEIIVVDNDEKKTIQTELKKKFPKVIYFPNKNKGYGQGNNAGAGIAKGEYLFILNPDTRLLNNAIDPLTSYLKKNKDTAIVAPLLHESDGKPYNQQGSLAFTPMNVIWSFSFLSKFFPNNKIKKEFWLETWDKKKNKEVQVVPGTALVIKQKLFQKITGFDENFFLYYEEVDLCKRVSSIGLKIKIIPVAKIYHAWGKSTQKSNINTKRIFEASRKYYFRKHYGLLNTLIVEFLLRLNKNKIFLGVILAFALYITTYQIHELMPFIGDQGWYLLSARDTLITGEIPLIGIPSSHPWLHQGAYWTYILIPLLAIFNYDPLSATYFSTVLHLITIVVLYMFCSKFFSERIGLFTAFLYATSPLIIHHARMPYHTSPIPFLTVLFFYAINLWIKGKTVYFPIAIFLLAILYNFEIATLLLTIVLLIILIFGFLKKTKWFREIFTKKILLLALFGFVLPMSPMLIYDFYHGFPQTIMVIVWVGYKILLSFGFQPINAGSSETNYTAVVQFIAESYKRLVYLPSNLVAFTLGVFSFGFFFRELFIQTRTKLFKVEFVLLGLFLFVCTIGIIATKTTSEAYLPVLFPLLILSLALFFDKLIQLKPRLLLVIIVILVLMTIGNISSMIKENFFITRGAQYSDMLSVADKIVTEAAGKNFQLVGTGIGSEHESFLMKYEYLVWIKGRTPSENEQSLRFIIEETSRGVVLKKEEKNYD